MRNCPKYLAMKLSVKVFLFGYMHMFVRIHKESWFVALVLIHDCNMIARDFRKPKNQEEKRNTMKFEGGIKIPWMSFC
jgi:hypothetical protein